MVQNHNHDISGEKNLPDKMTALKNMAKGFEMKMSGFKLDTSNEKWIIAGKALATSDLISKASGIIGTYTENINLITTKSPEKFLMEFTDAFFKVNVMILNDEGIPADNHRAIIKIFKDTMSNIGDVITGSRILVQKVFDNEKAFETYNYEE